MEQPKVVEVKNVGNGQNVDYRLQKVMWKFENQFSDSSSQLEFKLKGNRPGMFDVLIFVSTNKIKNKQL